MSYPIDHIDIVVTHNCNMKCPYCIDAFRGNAGEISINSIDGYVNANGVIMDFSYPIIPQPFQYDQLHIFAEYLYAHSDHYGNYNASIDDLFPSKIVIPCEEKKEELV